MLWLRLHASSAGGAGSIPGRGIKIPHAVPHGQNNKQKQKKQKNPMALKSVEFILLFWVVKSTNTIVDCLKKLSF